MLNISWKRKSKCIRKRNIITINLLFLTVDIPSTEAENMKIDRILKNLMTMPQSEQFDVRRSIEELDDSKVEESKYSLNEVYSYL